MRPLAAALLVALAVHPGPARAVPFVVIANSSFDQFTADPTPDEQRWMRAHYARMLTYAPYFDRRLAWFPNAWVYKDLYAVYVRSADAASHADWILHDGAGNPLYIPYAR